MDKIKIKAPATVANLSCGYDILGLCLNEPYDEIEISKISDKKIIIDIEKSKYSNIPTDPTKNTGGIPALLLQKKLKLNHGFKIKIKKGIPLSGGLGSSAASAVGVAYGINKLIGDVITENEIIKYALKGEKVASETEHADNIAPCLMGGLVLIKNMNPIDLIKIPIGPFYLSILNPHIKIDTKMARSILPKKVEMNKAVEQWSNVAGLTYGFTVNDIEIIRRSMQDVIIEPIRMKLIDGFNAIKKSATDNGAIGSSISGSGPSIFALCDSEENSQEVMSAMQKEADKTSLSYSSFISDINHSGVQII